MKLGAFNGRDRLRDLYDVLFIAVNCWDDLSPTTQKLYREAILAKVNSQYDHFLKNEVDEEGTFNDRLINKERLEANLVTVLDKMGTEK